MKQNIDIKQLTELSIEQLKKLNELSYNPSLWRIAYEKEFALDVDDMCFCSAINSINIGKMIEILVDNIPKTNYIEDSLDIECDRAVNKCFIEYRKSNLEFSNYESKELCDVLWEAVKSIL